MILSKRKSFRLYPDFSKPICYRNQCRRVVEGCLPSAEFRENLIKVIDYSIAKENAHQQNQSCVAPCGGFSDNFADLAPRATARG